MAATGTSGAVIEVTHQRDSGTSAVVVVELARTSTPDLACLLRTAIRTGDIGVIVDLGERGDASSELLMVLHRTARQLRTLGGRLAVVSTKPELRRLFDLTLLSQGFGVYASRDDALRTWA
jgi:anti-anti-sigma regulatory factor